MRFGIALGRIVRHGSLGRIFSVATDFVLRIEPARPLAYLRIGLGVFLIAKSIAVSGNLIELYGMRGMTQWSLNEASLDPSTLRLSGIANCLQKIGFDDEQTVLLVFGVQVLAAVGLIIGWQTRLAALLAWLSHFALENSAALTGYGADQIAHIFLFYCVIMPAGHSLSIDSWRRAIPWRTPISARLFYRLFQIHLCIIYFNSGLSKLSRAQWWNGDAAWRILMEGRFITNFADLSWLAAFPWLVIGLSWLILLLETVYPVLIWPRPTRNWWLGGILLMHLATGLVMGLWLFAWVMIVGNVAAFGSQLWEKSCRTIASALKQLVVSYAPC